jgi:tetratricopeptide (TPR) repeat protein
MSPAVEALLLAARGGLKQAEALARAGVAAADTETDNPWLQGWAYEDLASVLERAGRIDEARDALERALAVWERKHCLPYVDRLRERIDSLGRAKV